MDFFKRTTDSMAMMAGAVQRMASSAGHANALAISTSEIAQKGGRSVGEVVQTMEGLSESATKIVDISRVIHDIAFQTHLLALNAAVEAARVGESGMGFAVVASEVRALAQRSAAAAKEIRQLIEESVGRVRIGKAQAHEAGETMGEIVCSARTVMEMLGEITLASQEQAAEIGQIHGAVGEMNRATQSNLELVEKAAEATQTMHAEAEGLERLVRTFELPEVRDPR
jgi:methyl-accepting chemotaxis protein